MISRGIKAECDITERVLVRCRSRKWAWRDSNPHSRLREADFKSAASTDSATDP